MSSSSFLSCASRRRFAPVLLGFALALSASVGAAQETKQNFPSEKTGEAFQKLKPLQEAKNYDGMLALLDSMTPTVDPSSYDMALILDMKAKLYGQKEQFDKAIDAWETVLRLSEEKKYFDKKATLEITLYLAQFCYQVGTASKVPAVQRQYMDKCAAYFKKWLAATPKPPADISMFYASILYNQAVVDPKKVDGALLKQARAEVEKGIASSVHPKEGFYVLLLAIIQQENEPGQAAEILELLVKQFPQKKDYWTSLWATYYTMANEATVGENKDDAKFRAYSIRAINTMERAQPLGFMKSSKELMNLVSLYLNVGQFSSATDLLYKGMKNGAIESDVKNWLILGYYYQQANQERTAIAVLDEAAKLYPTNGQIEVTIAEIYRGMDHNEEARLHYRAAIRKGNLEKPHIVYQLLAYGAFELGDFDEAIKAVEQAEALAPAKDAQLTQLKAAIQAAIGEREAAKAESAKKNKI